MAALSIIAVGPPLGAAGDMDYRRGNDMADGGNSVLFPLGFNLFS